MLLVRDRPEPGESFHGYLLRLADYNGRKSVERLFKEYGVAVKPSLLSTPTEALREYGSIVASLIGITDEELSNYFIDEMELPWLFDDTRMIKDIRVKQLRLCPYCLTKGSNPAIQFDWSLLPVTHCEQHKVELIDTCPHCGKSLKWVCSVFSGCSECGFQWSTIPSPPPELKLKENQFQQLRNGKNTEIHSWLRGFCVEVMRAARPNDRYYESIFEVPRHLANVSALSLCAYGRENTPIDVAPEGWVKPRRLLHEDTLSYHVKFDGLADTLGIPSKHVSPLVENGIITPLIDTPVTRDQIFDVRDAEVLIDKLRKARKIDSWLKIGPTDPLLPLFDCSFGKLLSRALGSNTVAIEDNAGGLGAIYLPSDTLHRYLTEQLRQIDGTTLSFQRAQKILCLTSSEVDSLVRGGLLHRGRHSSSSEQMCGSSILELLQSKHALLHQRLDALESYYP